MDVERGGMEPGIFEVCDEEAEPATMARAAADIRVGRVVPHDEVAKRLATWGAPDEKPMPREWLD